MKFAKLALIIVLAAGISSCCSCRKGKSRDTVSLTGTKWQLTQLAGAPVSSTIEDSYTLELGTDKRVSGKGNCNRVTGSYELPGTGKIKFNGMASTRMMCPDQQTEDKFLKELGSADSYTIDGKMLMLLREGETIMVFVRK